jgi:PHD/YefM family antitoxin component YafN of YafNO toxin-antitoxin module
MIDAGEYEALIETVYLFSNPATQSISMSQWNRRSGELSVEY